MKQNLQQNPRLLSASSAPPASREVPGNRQYGRVDNPSSKDAVVSKYATLREPFKASSGNYQAPPLSGNTARGTPPSSTQPTQAPALIDLHSAPGSRNPQITDSVDGSGFTLNWDSMKSGWQNFGTKRFAPMRQDRPSNEPQPTSSQTLDSIFQGLRANRGSTPEEDLRLLR